MHNLFGHLAILKRVATLTLRTTELSNFYLECLQQTFYQITHIFNEILIRLVAQVKISLLLKIQWQEYDYLSEHKCGSVRELRSGDHDDAESGSTRRARGEDVEIGIG